MKPIPLKGRTEIIAAIYDPENLPSALIACDDNDHAYCLHSLREGDVTFFENMMQRLRDEQSESDDEKIEMLLYKFFENFPAQGYSCHGCYYGAKNGAANITAHDIRDSEAACTKDTADCA